MHCFNHVLNLIYPTKCGICSRIHSNGLCEKCNIKLKKDLFIEIDNYEEDKEKYFNQHIYISKYSGIIREKIIQYKFRKASYLHEFFSYLFLSLIILHTIIQVFRFFYNYEIRGNAKKCWCANFFCIPTFSYNIILFIISRKA